MNCKKRAAAALLALLIGASAAGCTPAGADGSAAVPLPAEGTATTIEGLGGDDLFTDGDKEIGYDESTAVSIVLSGDGVVCGSDSVVISGSTVTITDGGTYLLSGTLANGQLVVEAEQTDKLHIVLNGVNLNCDTSAALYVKQADKVFLTLASQSQNTLSNGGEFIAMDENNIDAVIFSKDDLTLNGTGALTIYTAYGHGIVSKDDLAVTGGTYVVDAAGHGLCGKDSVRIADGTFTLTTGKDGIHSEHAEDTALGYVYIAAGSFDVTSGGDGISASSLLQVEGGTVRITAGGGSQNGEVRAEEPSPPGRRGEGAVTTAEPAAAETETDTVSTKGLKAGGNLILRGGALTIDAADDAVHSNASLAIAGGGLLLASGDDGIHADANVTLSGGEVTISQSYEGIEGQSLDIVGGTAVITASDDGLNAAGGSDQSGFGGGMGRDSFSADENCYIKISGGVVNINASGDGIDSNGSLSVSGGETYVSGATDSGNGALDYNGQAQITGGIIVASGASGMAQNFGSDSTQGTILVRLEAGQTDGEIALLGSGGETILSHTPEKAYGSVVISCPQIKVGESYTLKTGAQSTEVKMDVLVYGSGGEMGTRPGGGAGERPEGRPDDMWADRPEQGNQ